MYTDFLGLICIPVATENLFKMSKMMAASSMLSVAMATSSIIAAVFIVRPLQLTPLMVFFIFHRSGERKRIKKREEILSLCLVPLPRLIVEGKMVSFTLRLVVELFSNEMKTFPIGPMFSFWKMRARTQCSTESKALL